MTAVDSVPLKAETSVVLSACETVDLLAAAMDEMMDLMMAPSLVENLADHLAGLLAAEWVRRLVATKAAKRDWMKAEQKVDRMDDKKVVPTEGEMVVRKVAKMETQKADSLGYNLVEPRVLLSGFQTVVLTVSLKVAHLAQS